MNEKQYNQICGAILAGRGLDEDTAHAFIEVLTQFESMLDDGDQEDFFGTEGWRHNIGWD